jgi:hypothetical protein
MLQILLSYYQVFETSAKLDVLYCCECDYKRGLDWILDFLTTCIQLVSTSNYSVTANLHTLQITTAHTKFSQPAVSSPAVPW